MSSARTVKRTRFHLDYERHEQLAERTLSVTGLIALAWLVAEAVDAASAAILVELLTVGAIVTAVVNPPYLVRRYLRWRRDRAHRLRRANARREYPY